MRTTLQIDDDVLEGARALARSRGQSLGKVISELARRGLRPAVPAATRSGFPVFRVAEDAPPVTDEEVRAALDDEP